MHNPWRILRRGLVPLSVVLAAGPWACSESPTTPIISQPFATGGAGGPAVARSDGGASLETSGTGGTASDAAYGTGGTPAIGTGGVMGAAGATGSGGSAGSGGTGGGMMTGAGGSGSGGMRGTGGMGGLGNPGRGGAGPSDAAGGAGGAGTPVMDATVEVTMPPPDADATVDNAMPVSMACLGATWTVAVSAICTNIQCALMPTTRKDAKNVSDGDPLTRYTSGIPQGSKGDEMITITFPMPVNISGVTITSQAGDGAAAYRIESANDGIAFSGFSPAVEGNGSDNIVVGFPAKTMKAMRITQTGTKDSWWSIHEITLANCTVP